MLFCCQVIKAYYYITSVVHFLSIISCYYSQKVHFTLLLLLRQYHNTVFLVKTRRNEFTFKEREARCRSKYKEGEGKKCIEISILNIVAMKLAILWK